MAEGSVDSKMTLTTSRFGDVEYSEDEVYELVGGLLGFEENQRFLILDNPTGGPLKWLQSVKDGKLAFIIAQPQLFLPDYRVEAHPGDLESIELTKEEDGIIYTIMVVPPKNPRAMTANLQGPLVINRNNRKGKQVVLVNSDYTTSHRVFQD